MTTGPPDKDDNDLVSGFTDPRLIHNYFEAPGEAAPGPGAPGPGGWGYPPGWAGSHRTNRGRVLIMVVTGAVLISLTVALVIYFAR
jgi:hypothetical protein